VLTGIDVSHFDPDLDYQRAHAEGAAFIVHKATEGTSTDPTYARRAPAIRASGAVPGAYHFLRSAPSAAAQVDHFLDVIGDPTGMLVQLDWELSGSDLAPVSMARAWVTEWHRRTDNHPVLIYLPHWVWADHLGSPGGLNSLGPLWASHYLPEKTLTFADASRVPSAWWAGYGGWSRPKILQYAGEAGRIASSGPADLNIFDGTLTDLRALARAAGNPTSTTTQEDDDMNGQLLAGQRVVLPARVDGRQRLRDLVVAYNGDGNPIPVRICEHDASRGGWQADVHVELTDNGNLFERVLADHVDKLTVERADDPDGPAADAPLTYRLVYA
jgi:GH25 family lysozyme M1 (1,4-beta-N-acetylmuramidase)